MQVDSEGHVEVPTDQHRWFAFHVTGDSMLPVFKAHDLVLGYEGDTVVRGDTVVAHFFDEDGDASVVLKTYEGESRNGEGEPVVELTSLNRYVQNPVLLVSKSRVNWLLKVRVHKRP